MGLFLGPKFRFWDTKSDFRHKTPILVNGPFKALGDTVHVQSWEQFFVFEFPSYGCLRKKKTVGASKSLPPPHCEGTSASNSPSALSARAGSYIAFITSGPRCFGTQRNGKTNQHIIVRGLQIPCGELARDLEVIMFTLAVI